ncbi:unnamed protein product [Rhizophagus irregularis]|nr:unnamed protein product [Rhizophagus irregularis]
METYIYEAHNQNVSSNCLSPTRVQTLPSDLTYPKRYIYIMSHESINVKEELGGELLDAEDSISSKIENVPADNHIHIIVEPPSSPATTGKRKAENFYGEGSSVK